MLYALDRVFLHALLYSLHQLVLRGAKRKVRLQTCAVANLTYPLAAPFAGLGEYISGSILFEETLYDKAATGEPFVELMKKQGIIPGIKTDKVLKISPGAKICVLQGPQPLCASFDTEQLSQAPQPYVSSTAADLVSAVRQGLVPLTNSNGESWTQGLTGLIDRSSEYYKQVPPRFQPRCARSLQRDISPMSPGA
jgi:Fructose-bisphosphate aldolase class-I